MNYSVNIVQQKKIARGQMDGYRDLKDILNSLRDVDRAVGSMDLPSGSIGPRLKQSCNLLNNTITRWSKLEDSLFEVAKCYEKYEFNVQSRKKVSEKDIGKSFGLLSLVGDALPVIIPTQMGTLTSGLIKISSHKGDNIKQGLDVLKLGNKVVGKYASIVKDGGLKQNWIKEFIGDGKRKSFFDGFDDQLKKYKVGDKATATPAEKLKVKTKWTSGVLSFFGNLYDNYKEFEENKDWGRMVGETVVETGYDLVTGWGTTALMAAVVPPPAVLASLATVGVTWAANGICKFFVGKDLKETVSDFINEAGERITKDLSKSIKQTWDTGKEIVQSAGKAITNSVNAVRNSWNKIKTGWKTAFGF